MLGSLSRSAPSQPQPSTAKSTNASPAAATKGGADYSELRRHVVSATLANHDIADKEEGDRVGAERGSRKGLTKRRDKHGRLYERGE